MDLLSCPKNTYDIMVKNLAFQWELDSVASHSIAPLFSPFVSNSELWAALVKNSEVECLHALTYSEIVRQCVSDPQDVFAEVMKNKHTIERSIAVTKVFNDFQKAGAEYKLGLIKNDQSTYNIVFKGFIALYCLERIQFMSSFAATFAVCEQGYFQGIGKLIQKIMQDEIGCHAPVDRYVIACEMKNKKGIAAISECGEEIKSILAEVVGLEYKWNDYLFSDGRSIVGLNKPLLDEWVRWNAQPVYDTLCFDLPWARLIKNPLPWMDNWLDINKFQVANQESDNANYCLNVVKNDLDEDEILDF
jgi:ribonucleoside-diphosphate reductase beta chain